MKILYAAGLSPNDSSLYRLWALERLGHQVIPFNFFPYESQNATLRKIIYRVAAGPHVDRFNRDLIQTAEREKPDLLWADKMLWMHPRTLGHLRSLGIGGARGRVVHPEGAVMPSAVPDRPDTSWSG